MTWQIPEIHQDADGWIHRDDDQPAIIGADGSRAWYHHGNLHREAGPAYIDADGTQHFWVHGKFREQKEPATRTKPPLPELEELRRLWRACKTPMQRLMLTNCAEQHGIQLKRKNAAA